MNALAPLTRMLPQADSGRREFKDGSLVIREKTMVVGNAIYSIPNVSAVEVMDLRKPVPFVIWFVLGLAAFTLITSGSLSITFLLCMAAGWMFFLHWKTRSAADYLLAIGMNSGGVAAVFSDNADFLKAIALELYRVIEFDVSSSAVFNITRSIQFDRITGSTISVGDVEGNIVNNVLAGA